MGSIVWALSSNLIVKEREARRVLFNTRKFRFLERQEKGQINLIEVLTTSSFLTQFTTYDRKLLIYILSFQVVWSVLLVTRVDLPKLSTD